MAILILLDAAYLALLALWAWIIICNGKTVVAQMSLSRVWSLRPQSAPELIKGFESVSYNRHMIALLMLRDPMLLYPQIVQDSIKNPVSEPQTIQLVAPDGWIVEPISGQPLKH